MKEIFLILFILFNRLPAETRHYVGFNINFPPVFLLEERTDEEFAIFKSELDSFIDKLKEKENKTQQEKKFLDICDLDSFFYSFPEEGLIFPAVECKKHKKYCYRVGFNGVCVDLGKPKDGETIFFGWLEKIKESPIIELDMGGVPYFAGFYEKDGERAIAIIPQKEAIARFYFFSSLFLEYLD